MKIKQQFYTLDEVADAMRISKQTLYNKLCDNRKGKSEHLLPPYIKQGGKTLFPISEFHNWIKEQPLIKSESVMHQ